MKIGKVLTTHPTTGQRALTAPPPPSKAILAKLQRIEGIQREAETEVKTIESLSTELASVRRKLTIAEKGISGVPEAEVTRRIREAVAARPVATDAQAVRALQQIARIAAGFSDAVIPASPRAPIATTPKAAQAAVAPSAGMTGPEQRIVDAVAWFESIGVDTPEQPAVAFLAGYSYGGGAYNNPRGRLNQKGLVEYVANGRIALTDAGRQVANKPGTPATTSELHERVLSRLGGPEQRLLRPLLSAYPKALSNDDLARAAGYTPGAGAYNNPRGRLRSFGLIEYPQPGQVVARALLFPERAG